MSREADERHGALDRGNKKMTPTSGRWPLVGVGLIVNETRGLSMASDARRLSRILWQARESLDMWAEVVESQAGRPDDYTRRLVKDIDDYRAERGWSSNGFGGESE